MCVCVCVFVLFLGTDLVALKQGPDDAVPVVNRHQQRSLALVFFSTGWVDVKTGQDGGCLKLKAERP